MLAAVNCGRSQSPSLVLSRRRSMRRLRLASLRCKVAFTRNPSGLRVLETLDTLSNPGKAERFRVFHGISPPTSGEFAWFRPRGYPDGHYFDKKPISWAGFISTYYIDHNKTIPYQAPISI